MEVRLHWDLDKTTHYEPEETAVKDSQDKVFSSPERSPFVQSVFILSYSLIHVRAVGEDTHYLTSGHR